MYIKNIFDITFVHSMTMYVLNYLKYNHRTRMVD